MSQHRAQAGAAFFRFLFISTLTLLVSVIVITLMAIVLYLSLGDFTAALLSPQVRWAIKLTVITTSITTALAVTLGIPAAYVLSRYKVPFSALIDTILDLPMVLPPLVAGIALLVFFRTALGQWIETHIMEFTFTTQGIVLAQFIPAGTFCMRSMKAAFDSIDPRMEQVARTLGCNERQAFWHVLLPQARNGLVAGAVMTWARAAGEFGPILMFVGASPFKSDVLPIAIFLNMSSGQIEMALSITVILIIVALVALLSFRKLGGRVYLW